MDDMTRTHWLPNMPLSPTWPPTERVGQLRRERAAWNVRRAFRDERLGELPYRQVWAYKGLGRAIALAHRKQADIIDVPFGWRRLKVQDRNIITVLPLWLYWPAKLWSERIWRFFGALMELGLWELEEDGGYWRDARWRLPHALYRLAYCFLHDTDTAPERPMFWDPAAEARSRVWRAPSHMTFVTKGGFLARVEYR